MEETTRPRLGERLKQLFQRHRRRLATLVLMLFLAAVAIEIGSAIPRETRFAVPLGAHHGEVTEARIDVLSAEDEEAVRSVTLRFRDGAPASLRQSVDLTPGEYEVSVFLLERDGTRRHLSGRLSAPADGVVRVALEES